MDPHASTPPPADAPDADRVEGQPAPAAEPVASAPPVHRTPDYGRDETRQVNSYLVAAVGWLLPGAGYWLIGHRWRGIAAGVAILFLYVSGLFIGGVRVIDVPGYRDGERIMVNAQGQRLPPDYRSPGPQQPRWIMMSNPLGAVLESPWYIAQVFTGPINLVASAASVQVATSYPKPTARLGEIGTLYCAVAGMLNFVVLLDAAARAKD